jgi:cytochrome c oxidase subunit IV
MNRRYQSLLLTWLALMVLLALTAGSALLKLGWLNSVLNLAIALAKALLVALVFMRLRRSHALVRIAAVTGLSTLAILFALAGTDYATRALVAAPWQSPQAVPPALGSR